MDEVRRWSLDNRRTELLMDVFLTLKNHEGDKGLTRREIATMVQGKPKTIRRRKEQVRKCLSSAVELGLVTCDKSRYRLSPSVDRTGSSRSCILLGGAITRRPMTGSVTAGPCRTDASLPEDGVPSAAASLDQEDTSSLRTLTGEQDALRGPARAGYVGISPGYLPVTSLESRVLEHRVECDADETPTITGLPEIPTAPNKEGEGLSASTRPPSTCSESRGALVGGPLTEADDDEVEMVDIQSSPPPRPDPGLQQQKPIWGIQYDWETTKKKILRIINSL